MENNVTKVAISYFVHKNKVLVDANDILAAMIPYMVENRSLSDFVGDFSKTVSRMYLTVAENTV